MRNNLYISCYILLSMKACIIIYNLENCSSAQRVKIQNTLYGYNDHSNGGKYKYRRKGIVEKYPHRRLSRGGLIIRDRDKGEIIQVLEHNKAVVKVIPIEIAKYYLN